LEVRQLRIFDPLISGTVPGASRLAGLQVELSKKARQRLKWFDYYNSRKHNARLTCRHFDISPQTFYRWKRRYDPRHLASLEDRSHRPMHLRQPTYSVELVEAVLKLREQYPRWGKDKLFILPPRSPKLNGRVERAQRTHTEEFYEVTEASFELSELNRALLKWEEVYNTIRPHQSLGYLTPQQFLERYQQKKKGGNVSLII